ncbi:MAG: hypothetical protein Q9181_007683, partial [Wetmoreana brouardii]
DIINVASVNLKTKHFLPLLEALTPGGDAYVNEADFHQPNFQDVLYGVNYATLKAIKKEYDPHDIIYAVTAVGSEEWYQDQTQRGRLRRT